MKRKIILGRYMEGDSWVHRLDPRAKTAAMPLFMVAVFLVDGYMGVLALLLFTAVVIRITRIPYRYYIRAMKPLMFLLLFILVFHILYDAGGGKLLDVGAFKVYAGGLEKGIVSASRMGLFIMLAAVLTFTTQPEQLAQGLGSLLRPLTCISVPTDRLVLMLGIALRFIPTIFEEAERLWKAQQSRGLDLSSRPLREKARLIIAPAGPGNDRRVPTRNRAGRFHGGPGLSPGCAAKQVQDVCMEAGGYVIRGGVSAARGRSRAAVTAV
ncbi:Energy-coupling factor transporter transmembrane protein EcfT [Actinobacillus pleuropneumoniae]|nr:Energy-coupling factor transporter transmembrane protein EcfT [Actinobacillus pleuropneumoniae]